MNNMFTKSDSERIGNPVITKRNEIIIPFSRAFCSIISLLKYDNIKDECIPFISFATPLPCRRNSFCIDKENDII